MFNFPVELENIPVKVGHQLKRGVEVLVRSVFDTREDTVSGQDIIDKHRSPADGEQHHDSYQHLHHLLAERESMRF